jgi:hypothetical protein
MGPTRSARELLRTLRAVCAPEQLLKVAGDAGEAHADPPAQGEVGITLARPGHLPGEDELAAGQGDGALQLGAWPYDLHHLGGESARGDVGREGGDPASDGEFQTATLTGHESAALVHLVRVARGTGSANLPRADVHPEFRATSFVLKL